MNKRLAEKERQDFIAANRKPGDPDMTALHDFLKRRETEDVNYDDLNDDDVLEDALLAVTDATKKKLLMRYKRLKHEVL